MHLNSYDKMLHRRYTFISSFNCVQFIGCTIFIDWQLSRNVSSIRIIFIQKNIFLRCDYELFQIYTIKIEYFFVIPSRNNNIEIRNIALCFAHHYFIHNIRLDYNQHFHKDDNLLYIVMVFPNLIWRIELPLEVCKIFGAKLVCINLQLKIIYIK